jgi:putative restriction endonuclease
LQHGISGAAAEGADSIVVSGGYEDDEDYGDLIIYTGAGGRDSATGRQIADQEFAAQNLALVKSEAEGLPVRVVRGAGGDADYSPGSGFRYDGLFRVEESWREPGKSG